MTTGIVIGVCAAYCEGRDTLENLCSMIPGDAQQYSLFRRDATPFECPFRGSYTFTYSRGHGECRSPVSRLDSCTESWRTFFRYQACPDVQGTESSGTFLAICVFFRKWNRWNIRLIWFLPDSCIPGDTMAVILHWIQWKWSARALLIQLLII